MGVPIRQQLKVGMYVLGKHLRGVERYPLVLMLEPLFKCNLACAGCGKIDYPDAILNRRMSFDDAMAAVDECGAPVVSIAGGEPLIHKELPAIVEGFIARKKYVYLCTNALLLRKRIDDYKPSPYLTFSIHLDGNEHHHDTSVCQSGVYTRAVEAIRLARAKGFRVNVNCTLFQEETAQEIAEFLDEMTGLDVEGVTIAPGFNYERAPSQEVFLRRRGAKELFRSVFRLGRERKGAKAWRLNHSSLYLDFLAGNQAYQCTPWGNPTRNVFGWQKPCYLLVGEGYARTFTELMTDTNWEGYGLGRNPKCAECMVHCGFEPSAVAHAVGNPLAALRANIFGPRIEGPMVAEIPGEYGTERVDSGAEKGDPSERRQRVA